MHYPLGLFQGYGIELEYMIVDRKTLRVRPIADLLIEAAAGEVESEIERGALAWSNELARHVIEFKTNGPAAELPGLARLFQDEVAAANALLEPFDACLMPTAMHPWMDPTTDLELWPYEYGDVYRAFDRIFGCQGHGWANLQSAHLNLPFADDAEFGRLHAALRLLLPILPALAASSPIVEGGATQHLDNRLEFYRSNARRIPSVMAAVVPEPVFSHAAYEREVLGRIYRDLEPHDPEGTLRHEWVNARGAIARFDRGAIEVRVLDVQECPRADLAVAAATVAATRALVEGGLADPEAQRRFPTEPLAAILLAVAREADRARLEDRAYLELLGFPHARASARELWAHLLERMAAEPGASEWSDAWRVFLEEGCLARRILARLGAAPGAALAPEALREVYGELCACLAEGRLFRARA